MNKKDLEDRILGLNQAIEQTAANYNALVGARMEVQSMLAKEIEDEKKEAENATQEG